MPVPLEQFVKQLEDSGILAAETIQDFVLPKSNTGSQDARLRQQPPSGSLRRWPCSQVATLKESITTMKKAKSGSKERKRGGSLSRLSDARIKEQSDWRGQMLDRIRILIMQADPEVVEEVKWRKPSNAMRGVPVWSHAGIICTGETYKNAVKLTFAKGASLPDPAGVFNSSLEGNTRRAIDFHEGDQIDEKALQALVRAAVALNTSGRL